jgi:hypothetical protein
MATCQQCGNALSPDTALCHRCGASVERMPSSHSLENSVIDHLSVPQWRQSQPLSLSLAALEWLAEGNHFPIALKSPLHFLLETPRRTSAEQRTVAGQDLVRRGIITEGRPSNWGSPVDSNHFRVSLGILARPGSRVRISILAPSKPPSVVTLFLAHGTASLAYFDAQTLRVAAPLQMNEFLAALTRNLASVAPPNPVQSPIWLSQIRLSTVIWRGCGKRAVDPIRREDAIGALNSSSFGPEDAVAVVSSLHKTGFVQESDSWLSLHPRYRYCMDLIWSEHIFEIEHIPFSDEIGLKSPQANRGIKRLLFVGPPGRRLLCTRFTVVDPRHRQPASTAPEDTGPDTLNLIALTYLSREELGSWLAGLTSRTAHLATLMPPNA